MERAEILFVGIDGENAISSKETLEQIQRVKALECLLELDGNLLSWDVFDNPDEPRTLFQFILKDREKRIDKNLPMADRPPFAVVTTKDNQAAIRLEFYEGHDALSLSYDIRSKELQDKKLPNFLDKDPYAYDPVKFLKDTFGIPQEISQPLLDQLHKERK